MVVNGFPNAQKYAMIQAGTVSQFTKADGIFAELQN
jgi:hypothetical protein